MDHLFVRLLLCPVGCAVNLNIYRSLNDSCYISLTFRGPRQRLICKTNRKVCILVCFGFLSGESSVLE